MLIIYEPEANLHIKAKSKIENVLAEIVYRQNHRIDLGLKGISNEILTFVPMQPIMLQIDTIKLLYSNLLVTDSVCKENIILDSYYSCTIEGARTTVENVKKAIKSNPSTKDDKMVVNSISGLYYSFNNELNIDTLIETWKIVTNGVCDNANQAGDRFRKGMVFIGNETETIHTPEQPEKIEEKIRNLYTFLETSDLDNILKAIIFHFYFVYIHPFCDGNGRTARIVMTSYLNKSGYSKIGAVPISRCINENLSGYYNSLKHSEDEIEYLDIRLLDVTYFVVYMLDALERSLISAIAAQKEITEVERNLITKMKRNNSSEISVKNSSKILGIPEDEAITVLLSLIEKGYVEPKDNIYKLKV